MKISATYNAIPFITCITFVISDTTMNFVTIRYPDIYKYLTEI